MRVRNILYSFILLHNAIGFEYNKFSFTPESKVLLTACQAVIQKTGTWCEAKAKGGHHKRKKMDSSCICSNPNAYETLVGCFDVIGDTSDSIVKELAATCADSGLLTIDRESFNEALLSYKANAKNSSEIKGFNKSEVVDYPIIVNKAYAHLSKASYDQFYNNENNSVYYGTGLLVYWGVVLLLLGIANWTKALLPNVVSKFEGRWINLFRKHITLPALYKKKRAQEKTVLRFLSFLIPSRLETLIITVFCLLVIVFSSINMQSVKDNVRFDSKTQELSKYTGDRTGTIATCITPLLILFAGRNNILQWITKMQFSTFITFHRWIGRIVFILLFVHAVAYTVNMKSGGSYNNKMTQNFMIWGTIAVIANGIILFQGLLYLRRKWYELFLLIHIILAVLFVVGYWIHLDNRGYIEFGFAAVAIWSVDRVIRFFKIVSFGAPKAEVSLLQDETLKVVVPKPKYWNVSPGGHVFIHFAQTLYFWQSHPFTYVKSVKNDHEIVLFCKVKNGVTKSLYKKLLVAPNRTIRMRVCVEGPYGETTPAVRYNTAVYFAGGIGITGLYCEAVDIAKKNIEKQSIKLHWVIRDYSTVTAFSDELEALKNTKIETSVYVSRPSETVQYYEFEKDLSSVEKDEKKSLDNSSIEKPSNIEVLKNKFSHINFIEARPSVDEIIEEEIKESNGSIAFVTCGAPAMMDDIRHSITSQLGDSPNKRIDIFEALQLWA